MTNSFIGRILIVDDDASIRAIYEKMLLRAGFQSDLVGTLQEMTMQLKSKHYDFVFLDLNLENEQGLDGLSTIMRDAPFTRVYVLTGNGSVPMAVESMKRGASGFFEKGTDFSEIITELTSKINEPKVSDGDLASLGLIGNSPALRDIVDKIDRLKDVDSSILLLGESGTGKEVIARAIHRTSKRAKGRFDAINCSAIPEALLESELFGHKRGSFTDAKSDRKGIFELCTDGTLLLDEIGDMPVSLQAKLLRVLQEWEISPIGSSETIKVNTRVIAATHRDIFAEAKARRFREDLYYRLSIVVLHIPPLRQRKDDIPLLVEHFLTSFNQRFNRNVQLPSPSTMNRLMSYSWPGNVRELQNSLERAVVLAETDQIDLDDIFAHISTPFSHDIDVSPEVLPTSEINDALYELPLSEAKQAFERQYLEHLVKRCHGNVMDVAERSGRYRADIYRLLNRHSISHSEFRR